RSPADGGTEPLLAMYDAYADRLYAYSVFLLADPDGAAAAVYDAFLVAAERASASLPDPSRLRPWLYALTRNECLRRRQRRARTDPHAEVAELARYGLDSAEIAAVLGVDPSETARVLAVRPAPARAPSGRGGSAGIRHAGIR